MQNCTILDTIKWVRIVCWLGQKVWAKIYQACGIYFQFLTIIFIVFCNYILDSHINFWSMNQSLRFAIWLIYS